MRERKTSGVAFSVFDIRALSFHIERDAFDNKYWSVCNVLLLGGRTNQNQPITIARHTHD